MIRLTRTALCGLRCSLATTARLSFASRPMPEKKPPRLIIGRAKPEQPPAPESGVPRLVLGSKRPKPQGERGDAGKAGSRAEQADRTRPNSSGGLPARDRPGVTPTGVKIGR